MEKQWKQWDFFLASKITADGDCSEIRRCLLSERKAMTNLDSILKSRDYFANKGSSSQGCGFSSGHVWMWELGPSRRLSTEELMLLNCGAGEDSWESLDWKEIKPDCPKGNQSWIFIGRTDAEPETPMLWLLEAQDWLTGKTLMLERLKAGGGGDNKAWDCWMVSMTRWTWVWVSSRNWW